MDNLGKILRKLREEKQLPLRIVASFLDIDQAILSKIERGQRKISRDQVIKLAAYFEAKEDDLLIAWLSDKLVYELEDEALALKALQLAEEKVAYQAYHKTDKNEVLNTIRSYFEKNVNVTKAWLFGSYARGEDDYKSDIDVMIEVPEDSKFSLFDLAEIQYQLEKLVPKKVDVVMRDGVKPQIMERILPDLKIIYER
ncbi:MAG: nucleotidyltransferase domain-containing protein [Bacteroidota bacterium]|nr:nucleotidyltransferase domain-containing protein [Bacteroidota bacterium]